MGPASDQQTPLPPTYPVSSQSLPRFLSRGVDWRDADGDEVGSPTIERFSLAIGLFLVLLVGSIMRTALLKCIDIFVLSFGFVDLSSVHRLSSTVRILSSSFFPRSYTIQRGRGPSRNLSSTSLGRMALIAGVFTLSATTSDSCSTSVSSHCMTATWSSFDVLGTLWRYELRHRRCLLHH